MMQLLNSNKKETNGEGLDQSVAKKNKGFASLLDHFSRVLNKYTQQKRTFIDQIKQFLNLKF